MPLVEEIPEIVRVTTTMIPALRNVRFIRGLVVPLSSTGSMNEHKALEELEAQRKKKQEERTKLRKKQNKKVLKVSDAMQCVEDNLNGATLILFAKGILNTLTSGVGGSGEGGFDLLYGRIAGCMIGKALQQKNKRRRGEFAKKKPEAFSEKIRIRKGKLHPYVTP